MENFNRLNDLYFKKLLGDKKRKNLTQIGRAHV